MFLLEIRAHKRQNKGHITVFPNKGQALVLKSTPHLPLQVMDKVYVSMPSSRD